MFAMFSAVLLNYIIGTKLFSYTFPFIQRKKKF